MFDKMNVHRTLRLFTLLTLASLLAGRAYAGSFLSNGNFATGNLTDWSVFTTSNGTNGPGLPAVASFDTTGTGDSNSAEFLVGHVSGQGDNGEGGGGLLQSFNVPVAGFYTATAAIASYYGGDNADAGDFSILVDGTLLANDNIGTILFGQTLRDTLVGSIDLAPGSHTYEILITRDADAELGDSPNQYVTNLTLSPVPEPGSIALLLAGGLCLLACAWRRRRQAAWAKA